ncbi:MAG: hypothetical protein KBD39_09035 [Sterolibacterium sp.]|nr:hypothetical protein [Sterolibacterium sp.]MBP9800247.1 hypothetical protein [Sterolibacterium sp.]
MNKLLPLLLSVCFVTSAWATDPAKPAAAPAPAAASTAPAVAVVKGPAVGELVTPAGDAAAMKEIIAKAKVDSDAAKAKAAGTKK